MWDPLTLAVVSFRAQDTLPLSTQQLVSCSHHQRWFSHSPKQAALAPLQATRKSIVASREGAMLPAPLNLDDAVLGGLISTYTGAKEAAISLDRRLADLGLDSIAAVELADELLTEFQFEIHSDELLKISLGALREYLRGSKPAAETTRDESSSKSQPTVPSPVDSRLTQRRGVGPARLWQALSGVSGIQIEQIEACQTLGELGFDSFLFSELQHQLEEDFHGAPLKNLQLDLNCTVQDLGKFVYAHVAEADLSDASVNHGALQKDAATPSFLSKPPQQDGRLANPFIALAQSDSQFENSARRSGFHGYWDNVAPLQNDLALAYITEAFRSLGVDLSEYPHGTEIPPVQHIPKYERLVKRLLEILESRYVVIQHAGKILRGSDRIDVNHSSQLCQTLRTQHPQFGCEVDLMALIGPKLAECISGDTDAVSVLFGSSMSLKVMEDFYTNAPMMSASTDQLITFLIAVLRSTDHSHEHPVRILEVGAGTGGTTARLAETLAVANIAVEYVFTDVSTAFVTKAKARFAKQYPWMKFEVLNLEGEAPATFQGRYDVTLGANVVHATSDRILTCRRLRETLRPGGFIVLSEVTRVIDWYDICFGLLDGWWLSEGGKGYPIQPADTWMDTFNRAGFSSMGFSTGPTEEANSQQLLVASNRKWDVPSSTAM